MNTYLMFRLYAPLCSWGDIAVGEIRPGSMHPSKSAVFGLLAASLGIRRDEETKIAELNKSFAVGICVESFGIPLSDFHTIQVLPRNVSTKNRIMTRKDELTYSPGELKTILSYRDYRCDAQYIIMLQQLEDAIYTAETGKQSLLEPEFHLYLGRKSCPLALPCQPQVIDDENAITALKKAIKQFNGLERFPIQLRGNKELYWENSFNMGVEAIQIFERRDHVVSRKNWQFYIRMENHYTYTWEDGNVLQ